MDERGDRAGLKHAKKLTVQGQSERHFNISSNFGLKKFSSGKVSDPDFLPAQTTGNFLLTSKHPSLRGVVSLSSFLLKINTSALSKPPLAMKVHPFNSRFLILVLTSPWRNFGISRNQYSHSIQLSPKFSDSYTNGGFTLCAKINTPKNKGLRMGSDQFQS